MATQTPPTPQAIAAAQPRRGLLRSGLARTVFVGLAIIILLVLLAFVSLSLLKSSRNQPPSIEAYPGADMISQKAEGNSDTVKYSTTDPIDTVGGFYSQRLGSSEESGCKRIYLDEKPSPEPGHSYYRCVVDSSLLEVQQLMTVTVKYQPDTKRTVVEVTRSWGPSR